MSRSMRSFVTGKTINKQVQLNNRLTTFTNPPIQTGDLYVTRDLSVAGNTYLHDLDICGNLTVQGNVFSYGTIYAENYLPGQIVNVSMLGRSELGNDYIGVNNYSFNIASNGRNGSAYAFPEYTYTPKIANSYFIVEFQTIYSLGGSDVDSLEAGIQVNGGTISTSYQQWLDGPGGGCRSGVIFPIVGRYTNSTISAKTIRVYINNKTDDTVTVNYNNSTWLKITEIGR